MSSIKSRTKIITLKVNGFNKNILTIKDIGQDSVEIFSKGSSHNVPIIPGQVISPNNLNIIDKNEATQTQITVHPNLNSKIASIGIHYKLITKGQKQDFYAYVTNVRLGNRLFPVWTSLGRNVARKSLNIRKEKLKKYSVTTMWDGVSLDTKKDSLCYSIFVANKSIDFIIPEDFPKNVVVLKYAQFQLIIVYWLFNQPTKLRGISYYEPTDPKGNAKIGYMFHEILNFTNDMTTTFLDIYPYLPQLKN